MPDARIIHASPFIGDVETQPANGKTFTLEEAQAIVGGYIQIIHLPEGLFGDGPALLVMAEEGKQMGFPPNILATAIGRIAGIDPSDVIVGDVLVCDSSMVD